MEVVVLVGALVKRLQLAQQHAWVAGEIGGQAAADVGDARPDERIYIDAFAGTGSRTVTKNAAPLLGEQETKNIIAGSAKIALEIAPPFDRYILIESNSRKFKELEKLKDEFPDRQIEPIRGDANEYLKQLCRKESWKGGGGGSPLLMHVLQRPP